MTAPVQNTGRTAASAVVAAICWLAIAGIAVSVFGRIAHWDGPGTSWLAFTICESLVLLVALAVAVGDLRRTAVGLSPRPARAWIPLTLAAAILLLGGLFSTILFLVQRSDACGGSNGLLSFECTYQPGAIFKVAGLLCIALSVVVFVGAVHSSRRASVALWLSPAIILGFDVLAWLLWAPHHGFGITPHNHGG